MISQSFDELLRLADAGDNRNIDMLVRDIYGGNYDQLQLPGELIACSFGKAATRRNAGACRQGLLRGIPNVRRERLYNYVYKR